MTAIIPITWTESNDRIDSMFEWCTENFGRRNSDACLSKYTRWEVQSFGVPPVRFKIIFYSDDDATLFKLRWL
jgi:hypothetical protein